MGDRGGRRTNFEPAGAVENLLRQVVEVAKHPGAERIVTRLFRPLLSELELIAPDKVSVLGRIVHDFRSCSDAALDDALASLLKERAAKVKPRDIRQALETSVRAEECAARERQVQIDATAALEGVEAAPADLAAFTRLLVMKIEPLKGRIPEPRYHQIKQALNCRIASTGATREQIEDALYGSGRRQVVAELETASRGETTQ